MYMCVYIGIYVYVCVYIGIYEYICVYIGIYVWGLGLGIKLFVVSVKDIG